MAKKRWIGVVSTKKNAVNSCGKKMLVFIYISAKMMLTAENSIAVNTCQHCCQQ